MALNLGVLKTPSGFLKVFHVVLGAICLGAISNHFILTFEDDSSRIVPIALYRDVFFFILVSFACLFTSFLLLLSFLFGDTAQKINKTVFDVLYHIFSCVFYLSAAIALSKLISEIPPYARGNRTYVAVVIALICAVLNSIFYAANACIGSRE